MTHIDFLKNTIIMMDEENFQRMKSLLLSGYIVFQFVEKENITKPLMAEKLCEYFERMMHGNKCDFDELLVLFFSMWRSIVGSRVEKAPKAKKNEPKPDISRARKYYDKFSSMDEEKGNMQQLIDFSRVMMCLYSAIIEKHYSVINDFDFSIDAIKPNKIIKSMWEEKDIILGKKLPTAKFDFSKRYNTDTCSLIVTIIMMFTIIGQAAVEG